MFSGFEVFQQHQLKKGSLILVSESTFEVLVKQLHPLAPLPSYALPGDAGADLVTVESVTIPPLTRVLVSTGIAIALPAGLVGLVHPRSGLAVKKGLTIVNAPGTIDSGYRGEIKVILYNTDAENSVELSAGDRIAQLVIQEYIQARFVSAQELPETSRGTGGFGSSGGFAS